jgi:hypothetical protein
MPCCAAIQGEPDAPDLHGVVTSVVAMVFEWGIA